MVKAEKVRQTAPDMRRSVAFAGVVVIALAAIACAGDPPPLSQPPAPGDVEPWPAMRWTEAEVPPPADPSAIVEMRALTAGPAGLVAVGFQDVGADRTGVVLWSDDGTAWSLIDDPGMVELEMRDVAAGPNGYAAIAQTIGPVTTIFLSSVDGRTWARADPPPGAAEGYGHTVAGSTTGFLASGGDPSVAALWRSSDGRSWEALPGDDVTTGGVWDIASTPDGWAALIGESERPTVGRSVDGTEWSVTSVPAAGDERAYTIAPGERGWLMRGGKGSCGFFGMGSCAEGAANWWSADGASWGRMPVEHPLDGPILDVAAGDRGFVAWEDGQAWSSPDGWTWASLGGPDDPTFGASSIEVVGDRIIVLGWGDTPNGSRARVFVGEPA